MRREEAISIIKTKCTEALLEEIHFHHEATLKVRKEDLRSVLSLLKQAPDPGYEVLMDLTAVDYLEPVKHTEIHYWLHNPSTYERLRIVAVVARDEELPSVCDLWEGANWYERELFDLFGIKIVGHPHLTRILMPDDWVGHPLRRDYALTEEPVEFKHGVTPKIPSEIIPNVRAFKIKS